MKSITKVSLCFASAFALGLCGGLSGCSKSDDEKLKQDVEAIRAIKEKEQADQEAGKKRIQERVERAAAGVSAWGADAAASAASAPKAASK
jgi:hypothetical protein